MSLETLLAAAWFVEQQDAQRDLLQSSTPSSARDEQLGESKPSEEQVEDKPHDEIPKEHEDCSIEDCSSKSESLPASLPSDKQNTSSAVNHDVLSKSLENLSQAHSPTWIEEKDYHKRVAGTREVHNKLEKNRRAHLKECFEILKRQLPSCSDEKKFSNLSILHTALRHIQSLHRKEREYEHEMESLAREKISAQQKLALLKRELSSQWEHIDFSAVMPDSLESYELEVREEQSSVSTSTATEEGFDWNSMQNDFEDEDGDLDIISDSDDASKPNSNTSSSSSFTMTCSPSRLSLVDLCTENPKTSSDGSSPVSAHLAVPSFFGLSPWHDCRYSKSLYFSVLELRYCI